MLRQHYENTRLIGTRRSRPALLALVAVAFFAIAALLMWMSPAGNAGVDQGRGIAQIEPGTEGSVATTGQAGPTQPGGNSGPALVGIDTIHEIETITGTNDGHELVGRRVDLHVPVQQHLNDVAFWVGPPGNRVLVVLARDTRDGEMRQRGQPSASGIGRIPPGLYATVSGTVERVPYAEAMYSWGLTNADRRELMDRPIYIRADSVTPSGSAPEEGAAGTSGMRDSSAAPGDSASGISPGTTQGPNDSPATDASGEPARNPVAPQ